MGEGNCTFLSVILSQIYSVKVLKIELPFSPTVCAAFFSTPHREVTAGAGTKRGITS